MHAGGGRAGPGAGTSLPGLAVVLTILVMGSKRRRMGRKSFDVRPKAVMPGAAEWGPHLRARERDADGARAGPACRILLVSLRLPPARPARIFTTRRRLRPSAKAKRASRLGSSVRVALPALALLLLLPLALAQAPPSNATLPEGVTIEQGGEPGVHVLVNGVDVGDATEPRGAIGFDPGSEANLTILLAPPPGVTWEIRTFEVGLLVTGAGGKPAYVRDMPTETTIPPGYTVAVHRSVDLSAFQSVGAGLFLMEVKVKDATGADLYGQEFYVHVQGNPLLTVAGATVTVISVGTGYGIWQILRDLKEVKKARDRHRAKEEAEGRLAKLVKVAGAGLDVTAGVEGVASAAGDADARASRLEKRRPIAWTATGLGLGGVGISWAQFLGYVPLDVGNLLAWSLGTAALFLTLALLVAAMARRLRERGRTRTLIPEGPERTVDARPPRR